MSNDSLSSIEIEKELSKMGYEKDLITFGLQEEKVRKNDVKTYIKTFSKLSLPEVRIQRINFIKKIIEETPIELARVAIDKSPLKFNKNQIAEIESEMHLLDFQASKLKNDIKVLNLELKVVQVKHAWYFKRYAKYYTNHLAPKEVILDNAATPFKNKTKSLEMEF